MISFIGFAPDLDATTPGAIADCTNIVPTLKGMAGAPTALDAGLPALAAECRGAAVLTRLDNVRRVFAGTQVAMYELNGTVFSDRSRVGAYTGTSENRWRFAQFGNVALACNETEKIQESTATGSSFADIAQAPKARIIETASGFVLAFGINDATVGGDRPDAWWCSNIYDHLTWTPGSGNQAAYGYLLDTPGEITAAKRLGKDCVAYKERSLYLGRYVGPPVIWSWDLIASDVGAVSQESVIDTGTAHLFIGRDDFYLFDGSRPRPLNSPVKEWFFANSDNTFRYRIRSFYDRFRNLAWWFYPTAGNDGALTEAIVYNVKNDRWGRATVSIQCVFDYQGAETSYDDWPPGAATSFDDIADLPYDSPGFDTDANAMGVFGTDSKIKTLTGPSATSSIITGDFGDDGAYTTLTAVKPRFKTRPTSSMLTHYTKEFDGDTQEERGSAGLIDNKYDALASGRYHRIKLDQTGDYEIVGFDPAVVMDGEE